MTKAISLENMAELIARSPFPYAQYKVLATTDDEALANHLSIFASSNASIRPRSEWNSEGREIYDRDELSRHAIAVAEILAAENLNSFVVKQERTEQLWFQGRKYNDGSSGKWAWNYLVKLGVATLGRWDGAIRIDGDLGDFLSCFLDYDYLFNIPIELISLQAGIMLKINHHLAIEYFVVDISQAKRVKSQVERFGILEFQKRGLA